MAELLIYAVLPNFLLYMIDILCEMWYNDFVKLRQTVNRKGAMKMSAADKLITDMVGQTVKLCSPDMIYLVSKKTNTQGEVTSFKLCVVVDDDRLPEQVETQLLLKTESAVPCDFIVYNITDWDDCAGDDCSFAYRVENGGEKLYVKGQ